ncbi:MAG TPA: hypothetical protein VLG92_02245 [Candidatus Saccharimonadia bacterium]|nr:hypothetical protein [Candidatus Saccharimonadia bacterium]
MSSQTAEAATRRGTAYLRKHQLKSGGFTIICDHPDRVKIPLTVDLGIHALMLNALSTSNEPDAKVVANGLAAYLERTIKLLAKTTFRDIDSYVLFYGLAVLYEHSPISLPPSVIATAVHTLVANEQSPGGPYCNALDNHTAKPDWLTNVSISRFIHHVGGPFPKLTAYITKTPPDHSRYYTDAWPLLFFDAINAQRSPSPNHIPLPGTIASQLPDGSWPITYIHKDPFGKSELLYGSVGLSTAVAIINLAQAKSIVNTAATPDYYSKLAGVAQTDVATLDPLIGTTLQAKLAKLISADTTCEIGPLAERFADALLLPHRPKPKVLQTLGLANLYNWVAYTIYDDFLDDEGDPALLSAANVALRKAVGLFTKAVPNRRFMKLVTQTFDTIDAANAWELANCRFAVRKNTIQIGTIPDYTDLHSLHDRSLSHGLPILGALLAVDPALDAHILVKVQNALKSYLIVRQLNDDLCDWKDDLAAGHISYVVAQVLRSGNVTPGKQQLSSLLDDLEQTFWEQSLPHIDMVIQLHASQAKQYMADSKVVDVSNVITHLIDDLADVASRMQAERQQASDFLHAFQS